MKGSALYHTELPEIPQGDIVFQIDFVKGEGSAARVFQAMQLFIEACEAVDKDLAASAGIKTIPLLVLEDIEGGSIRAILRTVLEAIPDDAVLNLDWKPIFGKRLLRAKHAILAWANEPDRREDFKELKGRIDETMTDPRVLHVPVDGDIKPIALRDAIENFEKVKDPLVDGDKALAELYGSGIVEFDMSKRLTLDELNELAAEDLRINRATGITLIVKKADFLGESMWEFKYMRKSVLAKILDSPWLIRFHTRQVTVRPGDALKCNVRIETLLDHYGHELSSKYFIEEVLDVVEATAGQTGELFDE